MTRQIALTDIGIAGFAAFTGALASNQALGLWRARNGGLITRAVVLQLVTFALWSFLVLGDSLFEWRERLLVNPIAQGLTDIDRLLISVPMAVLLIYVLPGINRVKSATLKP